MTSLRNTVRCVAIVLSSVCWAGAWSSVAEAKSPAIAAAQDEVIADPFGRLRSDIVTPPEEYWLRVGEALERLETLDGATYDSRYGILTLHGKPAEERGPFHLDDLMVALKAVYFEERGLGMTIDPDPEDPHGPEMLVKYFGGCENTAFGWILFECDRLLKSFSNGEDSLTREKLKPDVPEFYNMLELGFVSSAKESGQWNRFWLATDLEEGPLWHEEPTRSNKYQPILLETGDGNAVSFYRCRLYLRTEVMALQGGRMVPVKRGSSEAAERFAKHFSVYFDEFAELHPVFARAAALSRLVVLAEWIEKTGIPMDIEFIRNYEQQFPVKTPAVTPASTVSIEGVTKVDGGIARRIMKGFGGVDLKGRTFFGSDVEQAAAKYRDLSNRTVAEHQGDVTWTAGTGDSPVQVVAVPTLNTRLKKRTRRQPTKTKFGGSRGGDENPDAFLPKRWSGPQSDRGEQVLPQRMSLDNIDKYRQQQIRGPPRAVLADNRYAKDDRPGPDVKSPKLQLPSDSDAKPHEKQAPPPEDGTFKPKPDRPEGKVRTEKVPLPTGSEGQPGRPRGPPETSDVPSSDANAPFAAKGDRGDAVRPGRVPLTTESESKVIEPRTPRDEGSFQTLDERVDVIGRASASAPEDSSESDWGLRVFAAKDGTPTYNLPRLIEHAIPRYTRTTGLKGVPNTKIRIADQLALASELGDIAVTFAEPEIDQTRRTMYYPPKSPGAFQLVGYYPQSRSLQFMDGMRITFDDKGFPSETNLPDGTSIRFSYADEHQGETPWPRPVSCNVAATSGRAEPGEYRLVDDSAPAVRETSIPDAGASTPASPPRESTTDSKPSTDPTPTTRSSAGEATEDRGSEPSVKKPSTEANETPATPDELGGAGEPAKPDVTVPERDAGNEAKVEQTGPSESSSGVVSEPKTPVDGSVARERTGTGEHPLMIRPEPGRLSRFHVAPSLQMGQSTEIGKPIQFRGNTHNGRWTATLRSRRTPLDSHGNGTWSGDELNIRANNGSLLRVSLDTSEGQFAKERTETIRLVATRLADDVPNGDASQTLDFYVDLDVRWETASGPQRQLLSLPVRLQARSATPVGAMLFGFAAVVAVVSLVVVVWRVSRP